MKPGAQRGPEPPEPCDWCAEKPDHVHSWPQNTVHSSQRSVNAAQHSTWPKSTGRHFRVCKHSHPGWRDAGFSLSEKNRYKQIRWIPPSTEVLCGWVWEGSCGLGGLQRPQAKAGGRGQRAGPNRAVACPLASKPQTPPFPPADVGPTGEHLPGWETQLLPGRWLWGLWKI